jgi:hypothetical protein
VYGRIRIFFIGSYRDNGVQGHFNRLHNVAALNPCSRIGHFSSSGNFPDNAALLTSQGYFLKAVFRLYTLIL